MRAFTDIYSVLAVDFSYSIGGTTLLYLSFRLLMRPRSIIFHCGERKFILDFRDSVALLLPQVPDQRSK